MEKPDLDGVVSGLYEAAVHPELWPAALARLASHLDADGAQFLVHHQKTRRLSFCASGGRRPGTVPVSEMNRHIGSDPWMPILEQEPLLTPILDHHAISEEQAAQNPFYQEFLNPRGCRYRLAMRLRSRNSLSTWIVLHRADEPFHQGDGAPLQAQATHLRTVAKLHLRGMRERVVGEALRNALDQCQFGSLLVDRSRWVLAINRAAEAVLAAGNGLTIQNGQLSAVQPDAQSTLARLILSATDAARARGGEMVLGPASGEGPLTLVALPLKVGDSEFEPGSPLALVVLGSGSICSGRIASGLMNVYDLTPTEARIAVDLALGKHLDALAAERRVKISTIRTQVSAVLHKTGTHQQSELIRRILLCPCAHFGR